MCRHWWRNKGRGRIPLPRHVGALWIVINCMRPEIMATSYMVPSFPPLRIPQVTVKLWLPQPPHPRSASDVTKEIRKFKDSKKESDRPSKPPPPKPLPPPGALPPAPPVLSRPTPRSRSPLRLHLLPPVGRTSCRRLLLLGKQEPPDCTARRRAAPRCWCGPTPGGAGKLLRLL